MSKVIWALALAAAYAVSGADHRAKDAAEGITREQADAILSELKQIRTLLETQQKLLAQRPSAPPAAPGGPQNIRLAVGADPWLGRKDAPLTMVEYTDYQCGFCRQFHVTSFDELKKNYIDTGKLRFLSRDLPLEFHGNALRAAQAARCANEQGRFWELRDVMIANAGNLAPDAINGYAQKLGLKMDAFQACIDSGKYRGQVQEQVSQAAALEISGTPSFVLGRSTPEGVEGAVIIGAQPYAVFDARIKSLLSQNP